MYYSLWHVSKDELRCVPLALCACPSGLYAVLGKRLGKGRLEWSGAACGRQRVLEWYSRMLKGLPSNSEMCLSEHFSKFPISCKLPMDNFDQQNV